MKHHSVLDVTVSLYPYSFDLLSHGGETYGEKYVWFIIGWYPHNWHKVRDNCHICTVQQLEEALEGHLTTESIILH
ncbi:hypothetical protein RRG08_063654 [Elysia crispata]|uniref:Uncharacterized protein n=1 Tax=Elysia crispata TaxID=231223 RepID=A0AAE1CU44_9GAST|nr:hypothetical protein RRG08_063654 [Elysia crispata]